MHDDINVRLYAFLYSISLNLLDTSIISIYIFTMEHLVDLQKGSIDAHCMQIIKGVIELHEILEHLPISCTNTIVPISKAEKN